MSIITKYVSYFIFIFIDLYIYIKIFFREYFFYSPKINKINFIKSVLTVDGLDHKIYEFGDINASNQNTLLLIGGIPTDPMDSMTWLANEINQINDNLRVIILNMPYYEDDFDIDVNNKYAISNGRDLVTDKIIDFSNTRVDCKFSHENQGKKIKHFLDALNINSCHLVGHDRGAVILEYFAINYPEHVLSFSRGSQVWNYYEPEWEALAPNICVGPPHSIMSTYHQLRILLFAVIFLKKPLDLLSDTFDSKGKRALKGSHLYDRYTHVKYKSQITYKSYFYKFKQSLIQGGKNSEVDNRSKLLDKDFPIMQFQGEDEFKYNKSGTLISDQPYFGKYNLFKNEIEDIYPGCVGQDLNNYQRQYVTEKNAYKEIQLKPNARFSKFCLIPDSAHFNVIENPYGCAKAIIDFIDETN